MQIGFLPRILPVLLATLIAEPIVIATPATALPIVATSTPAIAAALIAAALIAAALIAAALIAAALIAAALIAAALIAAALLWLAAPAIVAATAIATALIWTMVASSLLLWLRLARLLRRPLLLLLRWSRLLALPAPLRLPALIGLRRRVAMTPPAAPTLAPSVARCTGVGTRGVRARWAVVGSVVVGTVVGLVGSAHSDRSCVASCAIRASIASCGFAL